MKSFIAFVLLLFSACVYAQKANPSSYVVIDTWWNHDYINTYCDSPAYREQYGLPTDTNFCHSQMLRIIKDFETKIKTDFTIQKECKGLHILNGGKFGLKAFKGLKENQKWWLRIYYSLNQEKQSWELMFLPKRKDYRESGTPKEIAHDICTIIKNQ